MDDISPELLQKLKDNFNDRIAANGEITNLEERIQSGEVTYKDAERYATLTGQALAGAFGDVLSSDVLPDGHMYYNIGQKTVLPMMQDEYQMVSDAAAETQKALNEEAGLHLQVQRPEFNEDRAHGIIDRLDNTPNFDDAAWLLQDPVVNFSQSIVDETIEKNVEFHARAGLSPKIVRTAEQKCCAWCQNLEGTYDYPVDQEVYRRHENCECVVDYYPGDGRFQNAHTKKWALQIAEKAAEARKELPKGSASDNLLERIQTATELAARPNYNRQYVESTLQETGLKTDDSFYENVDKNLQMSIADQLGMLEKQFAGIEKTQGTIELIYKQEVDGARTSRRDSLTTRITTGMPFSTWDRMMNMMSEHSEIGWCMPFINDSQGRARYIVTHEYGHILENALIAEDRKQIQGTHDDFLNLYMKQIEDIARNMEPNYRREDYLSQYGLDAVNKGKSGEFFTECFVNSQLGAPNVLGEAMRIWLEQKGY